MAIVIEEATAIQPWTIWKDMGETRKMTMSRRRFLQAVDDHVTGRYHSLAPWNAVDYSMCEECETEDCDEPCEKLKQIMEKEAEEQRRMDEAEYQHWLALQEEV